MGMNPLSEVFEAASQKFLKGAVKYGTFDPASDTRNLLNEAEAEILDAINYLAMYLLKVRAMQRKAAKQASNETKKRGLRKLKKAGL